MDTSSPPSSVLPPMTSQDWDNFTYLQHPGDILVGSDGIAAPWAQAPADWAPLPVDLEAAPPVLRAPGGSINMRRCSRAACEVMTPERCPARDCGRYITICACGQDFSGPVTPSSSGGAADPDGREWLRGQRTVEEIRAKDGCSQCRTCSRSNGKPGGSGLFCRRTYVLQSGSGGCPAHRRPERRRSSAASTTPATFLWQAQVPSGFAGVALPPAPLEPFQRLLLAGSLEAQEGGSARVEGTNDSPAKRIGLPFPLPAQPLRCYGREDELAFLISKVKELNLPRQRGSRVLMHSPGGGFGKTTLAQALLNSEEIRSEYGSGSAGGEKRFYIPCNSYTSADAVYDAIHECLCLRPTVETVTPELQVRSVVGREAFSGLMVLDGLESVHEGTPKEALALLRNLVGPRLALLVTMRGTHAIDLFDESHILRLPTLRLDAAVRLFQETRRGQGIAQDPTSPEPLLSRVDRIPLAIKLVATDPRSIDTILADLDLRRAKLLEELEEPWSPEYSLNASIDISLDSPLVTESLRDALAILAYLPNGMRQEDLFEVLGKAGIPRPPSVLTALLRMSLVERSVPDSVEVDSSRIDLLSAIRYRVEHRHSLDLKPVLLRHVWSFYLDREASRTESIRGRTDTTHAHQDYDNVRKCAIAAARHEDLLSPPSSPEWGFAVFAIEAFLRMVSFDLFDAARRRTEETLLNWVGELEALPLPSALDYAQQQRSAMASCWLRVGSFWVQMYDPKGALDILGNAQAIFSEARDRRADAQCRRWLGTARTMLMQWDEARRLLDEAHDLFVEVADKNGVADCLRRKGEIQRLTCDFSSAGTLNEEALALYHQTRNSRGMAECYRRLGCIELVHQYNGRAAITNLERAAHIYEEDRNYHGLANANIRLADAHLLLGDLEKAEEHFRASIKAYEDASLPRGVQFAEKCAADAECQRGRFDQAIPRLKEIAHYFCDLHPVVLLAASTLRSLGEAERLNGSLASSLEHFIKAKAIYEANHGPLGVASCLVGIARVQRAQLDFEDAIESFEAARVLYGSLECKVDVATSEVSLQRTKLLAAQQQAGDGPETFEEILRLEKEDEMPVMTCL